MTIITTPGTVESISPDSIALHPFDVLNQSTVNAVGTVVADAQLNDRSVTRIPYWAAPDSLSFVAEGTEIPESNTGLSEVEISTKKLAVIHAASNESLRGGGANVGELIRTQIIDSLVSSADAHVFGDATDGKLTGIGALAGVTTADLGTNLDAFIDAFLNVVSLGGSESDIAVVAHPDNWKLVSHLKDSTAGNKPLLDAVSGTTVVELPNQTQLTTGAQVTARTIMGKPVFLNRFVSKAGIWVLDRKNLVLGSEPMRIDQSEHSKFKQDSVDFRGTMRIGWKFHDEARVTKIAVAAA